MQCIARKFMKGIARRHKECVGTCNTHEQIQRELVLIVHVKKERVQYMNQGELVLLLVPEYGREGELDPENLHVKNEGKLAILVPEDGWEGELDPEKEGTCT